MGTYRKFRNFVNSLESAGKEVVGEGHKAGMIGTAFLHGWVLATGLLAGYGLGVLLVFLIGLLGLVVVSLPAVMATLVGGLIALAYTRREFGFSQGDFWEYAHLADTDGMLDSFLDFLVPIGTFIGLMFLIW